MGKSLSKILGAGMILAAALPSGCSQDRSNYNENTINWIYENPRTCLPGISVKNIERPKFDGSIESAQRLYNSIKSQKFPEIYEVTPKEAAYLKEFINKSPEKRAEILRRYQEKFSFLGKGMRDIAFISNMK